MNAQNETRPPKVTVIGAGTIGLGWITLFLGHGLSVTVNSRREKAPELVREGVALYAPHLPEGTLSPDEFAPLLSFEPDIDRAVANTDVVVENAPERLELKQDLFARIGEAAPPDALLLSSTSTFDPDALGARMRYRSNLVVGHPFNPPHVVPLVEVVAGENTTSEAIDRTMDFYRSVGRAPVLLRKPIVAFAANRLQSALLRESVHLVREGVVTVAELDDIVTHSIGLRWATTGPFRAFHLGGGPGGLRAWLATLGANLDRGWELLGSPSMDEETISMLVAQADEAFGDRSYPDLVRERDNLQSAVLKALTPAAERVPDGPEEVASA